MRVGDPGKRVDAVDDGADLAGGEQREHGAGELPGEGDLLFQRAGAQHGAHDADAAVQEEPQVPNFGPPGRGPRLKTGMVLAIEPMVNLGNADVDILDDGWTVVTMDGQLSAHFEHTVAITDEGPRVLTAL